jgi:hypothetical protein
MTCNTGGYEGKRVAGNVKYRVCYHRVVLFVTMNTLLPNGLVNALFSVPPHAPRPLTRDYLLPPHELGFGVSKKEGA